MGSLASQQTIGDDPWGATRRGHIVLFGLKSVILAFFIILVIVEYALYKRWWAHEYSTPGREQYGPYSFWERIGIALIADCFVTLLTLTSLLIRRFTSQHVEIFHPILALIIYIILFGLYVAAVTINMIITESNEVGFYNVEVWYQLAYTEAGLEALLSFFYGVLTAAACVAIRRKNRRCKVCEAREQTVDSRAA